MCRRGEVSIKLWVRGTSAAIGKLEALFQEIPEGRMPDDDFLPIALKNIKRHIESPLYVVHETRLWLKGTIIR